MFPLTQRKVIRGAAAHVKAGLGVGTDYVAYFVPIFMPKDGTMYVPYPWRFDLGQGGRWIGIKLKDGTKIEIAHTSKRFYSSGFVAEGTQIGITGNSGWLTSGPHAHIQIFAPNGRRIDPEAFNWGKATKPLHERVNAAFRSVFARNPNKEENTYYLNRIYKDITTYEKLIDVMSFWKSKGRTIGK